MRRLLLMRHAKSDWSIAGQADHERPLAPRGRAAAPEMGAYMARSGLVPDAVVVSTARRTRETWDLVAQAFDAQREPTYEQRVYEASAPRLLAVIRETPATAHTLLLVGHNPGLQELAQLLIGDADARAALIAKFPTAALAVIDFHTDLWNEIAPHGGRLDRFIVPRMLEK